MTSKDSQPFRVMLIEDEVEYRRIVAELLKRRFPTMLFAEATNGTEAMEKMNSFLPRLVVLDIQLPGHDGLHVTRSIKQRYPDVDVVILTAYDFPEYREAARVSGASHFLSKGSVTSQEIENLVEGLWEKRTPVP